LFIYKQANNNNSSAFAENDVKDLTTLVTKLRRQLDPVSAFLWQHLPDEQQQQIKDYKSANPGANQVQQLVVQTLNAVIAGPPIWDPERFNGVKLQPETIRLLKEAPAGPRSRLNRLLLEDAYPSELSRNHSRLPKEYDDIMHAPATRWIMDHLRIHPESQFFIDMAEKIGDLTESKVHRVALGCLLLSLFPLVEGVGMLFRVGWAGWLAIGEAAFFIPIEFHALLSPGAKYRWSILIVMIMNIVIVWYLFANRNVLFRHHQPRQKGAN